MWPIDESATPEDNVDAFFGPGPARQLIDNWAEVAWAAAETRRLEAMRSGNARLTALSDRALHHLRDVPRPRPRLDDGSPAFASAIR